MNISTSQIGQTSASTLLLVTRDSQSQIAMKIQTSQHHLAYQQDILKEYQILKQFKHENIIEVGEFYDNLTFDQYEGETGVRGFEMELAQQDLLSYLQKLKKQLISPIYARRIFLGIARGVQYIHGCEIIHNDIKLENILLFENGEAKLADFGFACPSNQPFEVEQWKFRAVSILAPEIIKAIISNDTNFTTDMKKTDSFAFGVTLFESLFHLYPYEERMATDKDAYYSLISRGNYDAFWDLPHIQMMTSKYQRDFPPSDIRLHQLKDLLNKLLTSDPTQRLSFNQIVDHPWMKTNIYSLSDFKRQPS